jgi:hypothetical protein
MAGGGALYMKLGCGGVDGGEASACWAGGAMSMGVVAGVEDGFFLDVLATCKEETTRLGQHLH